MYWKKLFLENTALLPPRQTFAKAVVGLCLLYRQTIERILSPPIVSTSFLQARSRSSGSSRRSGRGEACVRRCRPAKRAAPFYPLFPRKSLRQSVNLGLRSRTFANDVCDFHEINLGRQTIKCLMLCHVSDCAFNKTDKERY